MIYSTNIACKCQDTFEIIDAYRVDMVSYVVNTPI